MATQQRASGLYARAQSLVDKVVSPATRKHYYDKTLAFAHEQPLLFFFLLIQLLISFTPIALFLSFVLGTLALSFITAILFSLFWIGVALLVLVPALFITVSLGIIVWIWTVSSFLIARWVYNIVPSKSPGSTATGEQKVVVDKSTGGYTNSTGPTTKDGIL